MIAIYGTIGPGCADRDTLEQMFAAGMTGMRLNLSHTSLSDSASRIAAYHEAARAAGVTPELLIDMQGPELRIGDLPATVPLSKGEVTVLGGEGIPVPDVILPVLQVGDEVLLDDGKISLRVAKHRGWDVLCIVERGGILYGRKSIKLKNPDAVVELPVLTEHDLNNVRDAAAYGVTGLMQPFVRSGEELRRVREALAANSADHVKIFAKIENMQGVENLEDILPEADVIIIARGDLGNDMDLWQLPAVQKRIAAACVAHNKPFIVVTQMLASMERSPVPTRAEVSDIFNAVCDGATGVMVTGETAVGAFPVEVIRYLTNTAEAAVQFLHEKG